MQNNRTSTATDPADVRAHAQADLGMARQLEVTRKDLPHPRRGGCSGYPVWFRIVEVSRYQSGLPPLVASRMSIRRWIGRLRPFRRSGNKKRSKLVGIDVLNLALFLIAHPDAMGEEICTYLYNEGADELFSLSTLYQRMKELGYSKKFASVEAYQASRSDVVWKEYCFFNLGLPAGINGVPRCKFMDVDKFAMS